MKSKPPPAPATAPALANDSAAVGQDLAPEHESPERLVLGVNTTRWHRHKNGEVSPEQIERVARRLASASPQQLRVVVWLINAPKKRTTCGAAGTTRCSQCVALARRSARRFLLD